MSSRTANLLKALELEEQQNKERLLRALLWLNAPVATIGLLAIIIQNTVQGAGIESSSRALYFGLAVGALPSWLFLWLDKRIPYTIRAAFPVAINVLFGLTDFVVFGLTGEGRLLLLIAALFAGILFSWRAGAGVAVTAVVGHAVAGYFIQQGSLIPTFIRIPGTTQLWYQGIYVFLLLSLLATFVIVIYLSSVLRILNQQQTLINEVERQRTSLEKIVGERTSMLSITNEINRSLTSILDPNRLVKDVVQQLQHAFNYYHVHIYLLDETKSYLYIAAATGETGSALLLGKHRLSISRGIIGRAVREKRPILAANVKNSPDWVANPLLPETQSELAVPILSGSDVLGVLDVQHNTIDGLGDQDEQILTNIALQTGVALRNAKIYETAQSKSQRESAVNSAIQKINLAPDLESTIQVVVEEVGKELKAPQTSAFIDLELLQKVARTRGQQSS